MLLSLWLLTWLWVEDGSHVTVSGSTHRIMLMLMPTVDFRMHTYDHAHNHMQIGSAYFLYKNFVVPIIQSCGVSIFITKLVWSAFWDDKDL